MLNVLCALIVVVFISVTTPKLVGQQIGGEREGEREREGELAKPSAT